MMSDRGSGILAQKRRMMTLRPSAWHGMDEDAWNQITDNALLAAAGEDGVADTAFGRLLAEEAKRRGLQ